jgi:outer membrane protein assembly factor BamB/orotate phosphoribosyltransferase
VSRIHTDDGSDPAAIVCTGLKNIAFKPGEGWQRNGERFGWIIDARTLLLDAAFLPHIASLFWKLLRPYHPGAVAGTGVSGIPLVTAVIYEARSAGYPLKGAIVRSAAKPYGLRKQVEGPFLERGTRVVLVDDFATSGNTLMWLASCLAPSQVEICAAAVLADFGIGAVRSLTAAGIPLTSCFTLPQLGIAAEPGALDRAEAAPIAWVYSPANQEPYLMPHSSPAATESHIVFGTDSGLVVALAPSGEILWRTALGGAGRGSPPEIRSSALIDGESVFIGADDGYLYHLSLPTGTMRWRVPCGTRVRSSPTLDPRTGLISIGAARRDGSGALLAISREGRTVWEQQVPGQVTASPAVDPATGAVMSADDLGVVRSYDLRRGEERWCYDTRSSVGQGLVVDQASRCYFGSLDGRLHALDADTGRAVWTRRISDSLHCAPLVLADRVIAGGKTHIACLKSDSGEVIWWHPIGGRARGGGCIIGDDRVAFGAADGSIVILSVISGQLHGTAQAQGGIYSSLALSSGVLVASAGDGNLYAFAIPAYRAEAATSGAEAQ